MKDFFENVGAGGYSALNNVLFGLPEFLVKLNGGSEGLQRVKDFQAQHKAATTVGDVAGTVGSMFIPGGTVLKGLSAGAKAAKLAKVSNLLAKAGKFAAGTGGGVGKALARGALLGAEQAIPRALIGYGTNGDMGEAINDAAFGTLAGGAIGAGGNVLGKGLKALKSGAAARKVGDVINDLGDDANRAYAGTMGITKKIALQDINRNVGNIQRASGRAAGAEAQQAKELVDFGKKHGLQGQFGRGRKLDQVRDAITGQMDEATQKALVKNPEMAQQIQKDVLERIATEGADPEVVKKIAADFARYSSETPDGIIRFREALNKRIKTLYDTPGRTEAGQAELEALQDARNSLLDALDNASGGKMKELNKDYRSLKMTEVGDIMGNLGGYNAGGGGSPTQLRTNAEKIAQNALMGAGIGSGGALLGSGKDGEPLDLGKVALAGVGGAMAGGAINKAIPLIQRKGRAALTDVLERLQPLGDKLASSKGGLNLDALESLVSKGEKILPKVPGALTRPEEAPLMAEADQAQAEGNAPKAELMATLNNRLDQIYQSNYSDLPREDFDAKVSELTQGFSDKRSLGRILYDNKEDLAKYEKQLQAAEALEGIDTATVLKQAPLIGGRGREGELQEQRFLDALALARSGFDAGKITATDQKAVKQDLEKVRKFPELLPDLLESYGLDTSDLKALGVV